MKRLLLASCVLILEAMHTTRGFFLQPSPRSSNVNLRGHNPMRDDAMWNETSLRSSSGSSISRRDWLRMGFFAAGAGTTLLASSTLADTFQSAPSVPKLVPKVTPSTAQQQKIAPKPAPKVTPSTAQQQKISTKGTFPEKFKLAPVNLTKVASENTINVTMLCQDPLRKVSSCVSVDRRTFSKVRVRDYPNWWPNYLRPPPVVIREFTNSELLIAGLVAGASIDVIRSAILYPISTIKTRIQAHANRGPHLRRPQSRLRIKRRLLVLALNIRRTVKEGNLYAGLLPTLLASVPATGIYYGTRDVTKRLLNKMISDPSRFESIAIALTGAFVGDIVSLAARTPVDALALRLQVASGEEPDEEVNDLDVGDWLGDSVARLPAVIATDLPYLLSRITFNMLVSQGNEDIASYEVIAITTAMACAILTTPFDVARTRILVDSDGDPSNGFDGGSRQGVLNALQAITREGDGGIRNLFAGWFERTAYLGIGRAWLDPILLITYVAIRDIVLLEWFD